MAAKLFADPAACTPQHTKIDWGRIAIVVLILAFAIGNERHRRYAVITESAARFPFTRRGTPGIRISEFHLSLGDHRLDRRAAARGISGIDLSPRASASLPPLMPVEKLPAASWQTAFRLG